METPFLAWTGDFGIGHAALDAQHRRLVEVINQVCGEDSGAPDRLKALLDALTVATVAHFKDENSVLREIGGWAARAGALDGLSVDAINEHCAEHARALLELEAIIHARQGFGAAGLGQTLIDWFLRHALEQDLQLKDLMKAYFSGAARAQ